MNLTSGVIRGWTIVPNADATGGVFVPIYGPPQNAARVRDAGPPPFDLDGHLALRREIARIEAREARIAEGLAKGEWTTDLRDFAVQKYVETGWVSKVAPSGAIEAVVSTDDQDRMGDVIEPEGWVLDNYRQNPVVLWAHEHTSPPVGRCERVWVSGKRLLASIKFAGTERAREIAALYRSGDLTSFSVGFRPLRWEPLPKGGTRYLRQELLEISCVSVPALPAARVSA